MWGRVGESRFILLDGLRMKRLPLYFNKGVILLISLAMQMEAFAQRGRVIPQDWGDEGGSYSHDGGLGDLWMIILIAAILGVLFIISKIQSVFKRKDEHKVKQGKSKLYSMESERLISKGERRRVEEAHKRIENDLDALPDSFFNTPCFTFPKEWRIIPNGMIEKIKSRVIRFANLDIDIDVDKLNKFEAIIVPHDYVENYKRLLSNYKGIIYGDKAIVWLGSPMTYNSFNEIYDGYELFHNEDNQPYIVTKNGFRTYFTEQLIDCFKEYSENKKPKHCLIREQYYITYNKLYFDLYSYIKP